MDNKDKYIIVSYYLKNNSFTAIDSIFPDGGYGFIGGDLKDIDIYGKRFSKEDATEFWLTMSTYHKKEFEVMTIRKFKLISKLNQI